MSGWELLLELVSRTVFVWVTVSMLVLVIGSVLVWLSELLMELAPVLESALELVLVILFLSVEML